MAGAAMSQANVKVGDRIVYFGLDKPLFGVVRWLGTIEDISEGITAGIALAKHGLFIDANGLMRAEDFGEVEDDDSEGPTSNEEADEEEEEEESGSDSDEGDDHGYGKNKSKPKRNVDDLIQILELSIWNGMCKQAQSVAAELADLHVNCKINLTTGSVNKKKEQQIQERPPEKELRLDVQVETSKGDKEAFSIAVPANSTLQQLRQHVKRQFVYSEERQRWFFNGDLIKNDSQKIKDLNQTEVILYIKDETPKNQASDTGFQKVEPKKKKKTNNQKGASGKKTAIRGLLGKAKVATEDTGWKCKACTYLNEPARPGCGMCGSGRPEDYIVSPKLQKKYDEMQKELEVAFEAKHQQELKEKFDKYVELDNVQLVLTDEDFECKICFTNVGPSEGIRLRDCLHAFCRECLKATIQNSEDIPVKCPFQDDDYACDCMLQYREVQQLLSPEDFQKFLQRDCAKAAGQSKNTFHCKTPDCIGWCYYEYGAPNFPCDVCGKTSCITCQAIHKGENCKQYQDRLKLEMENNETARQTMAAIEQMKKEGTAMDCPGCGIMIMKTIGCDGMMCSYCKIEICWATKGARWGPKVQVDLAFKEICLVLDRLKLGDRIVYFDFEKPFYGTVRWLGTIKEVSNGLTAGIELDKRCGQNDGTWNKRSYFRCKAGHGIFIDANGLMQAQDYPEIEDGKSEDTTDSDEGEGGDIDDDDDYEDVYNFDGGNNDYGKGKSESKSHANHIANMLEMAMKCGLRQQAKELAAKLADLHISCQINLITGSVKKTQGENKRRLQDELLVDVKVENNKEDEEQLSNYVPADCILHQLKEKTYKMQQKGKGDKKTFNTIQTEPKNAMKDKSTAVSKQPGKPNVATENIGWTCKACTFLNDPARPGCSICGCSRPEDYIVPPKLQTKYEEMQKELELAFEAKYQQGLKENFDKYIELDDAQLLVTDEDFECKICFTDIEPGEGIRLRNCLHTFCRECLKGTIQNSKDIPVKCPFQGEDYACNGILQHREIQQLLSPEDYQKYLNKDCEKAMGQSKNTFHCKTLDCNGWCYYESGAIDFPCQVCGKTTCITCQAIHQGENCKEYQDRLKLEMENNEKVRQNQRAVEEMKRKGEAMDCPGCGVVIMKTTGCNGMTCSYCKIAICWATKGPRWGPKGRGDTSGGCRCGVNDVRCHPNCWSCH